MSRGLRSCCAGRRRQRFWRCYFFLRGEDNFGIRVRSFSSIAKFLAAHRALGAIRAFNLTHMNRGRNAYQASHCYSLADHMLSDEGAE